MNKITNLKKAEPKVNQATVELMNSIMEKVLQGEVTGIVMFMSATGGEIWEAKAGDVTFSEVVLGYEHWKFRELMAQNMEQK
jgi:hypothetical protein